MRCWLACCKMEHFGYNGIVTSTNAGPLLFCVMSIRLFWVILSNQNKLTTGVFPLVFDILLTFSPLTGPACLLKPFEWYSLVFLIEGKTSNMKKYLLKEIFLGKAFFKNVVITGCLFSCVFAIINFHRIIYPLSDKIKRQKHFRSNCVRATDLYCIKLSTAQ